MTAGVKGTLFGGWNFDLGSTYGSDNDSIYVDDSANIALYATRAPHPPTSTRGASSPRSGRRPSI